MTRLFCVGIVIAAVLFAVPAFASVPFVPNCSVAWFQPLVGDTLIGVCPAGDWTKIDVTVKDQFNLPIAGQAVTATFANPSICVVAPITGITDGTGYVRLTIRAGTNSAAQSPRLSSGYTVQCLGTTLKSGTTSVVSADYNCNGVVNNVDQGFFGADWLSGGGSNRSDYNDSKVVNNVDQGFFGAHWLHF